MRGKIMAQDLWINLPVKDLARSIAFFTKIGFATNLIPGNSEKSASFIIGEKKIVLMLFVQEVFSGFANNALSDPKIGTEVLFSLGADSREQVDDIANCVRSAGGKIFSEPTESNGFMYGCGFCDLDGHRWNVLYMDANKMSQ
jgi:uncharacterized protein